MKSAATHAAAGERRGPRLRRRRLPARMPRQRPGQDTASSRSWSSTTARPTAPARSPRSTPPATPRVRVVHTDNRGLGAARNEGMRHATGDYLGVRRLRRRRPADGVRRAGGVAGATGSDFVTGSIARWEARRARASRRGCGGCTTRRGPASPPRAPGDPRRRLRLEQALPRARSGTAPACPGPRASATRTSRRPPAPTSAGRFDVLPDVVYHWRIRADGSSITQQRVVGRRPARPAGDQADVAAPASTPQRTRAAVPAVFLRPGARRRPAPLLHRDPRLLRRVVGRCCAPASRELWGDRSLAHSGLPPVHRLTGWLVEQDRRDGRRRGDAYVAEPRPAPLARVDRRGRRCGSTYRCSTRPRVDPAALALRPHEPEAGVARSVRRRDRPRPTPTWPQCYVDNSWLCGQYWSDYRPELVDATVQHLWITVVSVLARPRRRRAAGPAGPAQRPVRVASSSGRPRSSTRSRRWRCSPCCCRSRGCPPRPWSSVWRSTR